jgi:hypothetical protein
VLHLGTILKLEFTIDFLSIGFTKVWSSQMQKTILFLLFCSCVAGTALAQQDSASVADSTLLKQIEQQMKPAAPPTPPSASAAQPRSGVSTNPNISAIGDFQAVYRTKSARSFNFNFNEAELAFQSFVDPYARADFYLSFSKDPTSGKFAADIEEAYVTTLDLPEHLQLKAGKFRMALGRINPTHPHALPFIDLPNALVNYFGEEGLNDEGLSLSWLVPNPLDFYQELTLEITGGPVDNPSFVRSTSDRYLYLGHLKNFWDLTPNSTLELGLTGIAGQNDSVYSTIVGAVDITYKWKPLQFNTYQSLVFQSEAFISRAKFRDQLPALPPSTSAQSDNTVQSFGMYSFITYQLEKRWFLTGRFDYSNFPFSNSLVERAYSATLGWYATEFQKIEIEAKTTTSNFRDQFHQALLRWIFVIGAHGAHAY